jgi:hypothetical protein
MATNNLHEILRLVVSTAGTKPAGFDNVRLLDPSRLRPVGSMKVLGSREMTSRHDELDSEICAGKTRRPRVTGALLSFSNLGQDTREHCHSESISGGRCPSGSSVLRSPMDFRNKTGLNVKNKTPHRNFFGNPRMRSDLFHLFPRVLFRVLVRKEAHRSGRRVAG